MPYVLMPRPRIEALGAVFVFGSTDAAMAAIAREVEALRTQGVDVEQLSLSETPLQLLEPICALFVECVEEWEGVVDPIGNPVPCTREARARFPLADKVAVATAYLEQYQALEGNGQRSDVPPTSGTPDASE